jgi:putative ATP-dependent endonuclease of OLD family
MIDQNGRERRKLGRAAFRPRYLRKREDALRVARLTIERFRCVKSATLDFAGHTLFVGANNVGKSTICEAIDLVLGPDRLSRYPVLEEFDFYNAQYLDDQDNPQPLRVEVLLTDLSAELQNDCGMHLEFWHEAGRRILQRGELELANAPSTTPSLRLETVGRYDAEEDEFEAQTYFSHGTLKADGSLETVNKRIKRPFGFIYLRTLRTGSRALSLERNSLLDIILRLQGVRTGLWERAISRLRNLAPPIGNDADELTPVLRNIEQRLEQYIPLQAAGDATGLYVSQLTRDHLRKTLSFFLSTNADQAPVPFHESGSGTLNTLVLALLSFIADAKPGQVIFAMEEPEIALPPHTQRRIANYLLKDTAQCMVSSHSPYVIERFEQSQIQILRRDPAGTLTATPITSTLQPRHYKRHARRGVAEAMLGNGVIIAEGVTEQSALQSAVEKLEASDANLWPLDLAGVTIFPVDGDGDMPTFGAFFKPLGLKTFAFYDRKQRTEAKNAEFAASFDIPRETAYDGIEKLLVDETPAERHWQFLEALRNSGLQGNLGIPAARPTPEQVAQLIYNALKSNKGNYYAGQLIELCSPAELPRTITTFLREVYALFPKPERPAVLPPVAKGAAAPAPQAPPGAAAAQ